MQDLLRYDDYNNDGHLSLHEFYTAFRKYFSILFFSPYKKCTVNLLKYVRIILTYSDISHLFVKKDGTKNMCKVRVTYLLLVHFRISQHHNSISLSTAVLRIKDFLEQIN